METIAGRYGLRAGLKAVNASRPMIRLIGS
jgi:hypothetical protein